MRFRRRRPLGSAEAVHDQSGGDERAQGRAGTDERGRSRFERIIFSFMGPPQLGDVNAPRTVAPDPAAALCHKCGLPWDEHEIVRTTTMTYAKCPTSQT